MDLSAIAKLNQIPLVPIDKTREKASEHGQCVQQLITVRQQTTKFSAGTLPISARVGYKPTCTNVGRRSHRKKEEEVFQQHDSDFDSNLCLPQLRIRRWSVMLWCLLP